MMACPIDDIISLQTNWPGECSYNLDGHASFARLGACNPLIMLFLLIQARYKIMDQIIKDIDNGTCHFGFSKLKGTGGLAPEVQRQLRILNLAAGKNAKS
jgi:hypothetical protein